MDLKWSRGCKDKQNFQSEDISLPGFSVGIHVRNPLHHPKASLSLCGEWDLCLWELQDWMLGNLPDIEQLLLCLLWHECLTWVELQRSGLQGLSVKHSMIHFSFPCFDWCSWDGWSLAYSPITTARVYIISKCCLKKKAYTELVHTFLINQFSFLSLIKSHKRDFRGV